MRYFIKISYDGSLFYGFQRLNNSRTVQNELEKALSVINKREVLVKGAGRTDRGVHALGQGVHFDLDVIIPVNRLKNALNSMLPSDIKVLEVLEKNNDFHARFSVKTKVYKYVINLGKFDVLRDRYLFNYCNKLNIIKMKKLAKAFVGCHNFKAFVAGYRDNYNSEIKDIKFKKKGNILEIYFIGTSFYRYMVRNLVGALIIVGSGKKEVSDVIKYIDADFQLSNLTVPASGLYLLDVKY